MIGMKPHSLGFNSKIYLAIKRIAVGLGLCALVFTAHITPAQATLGEDERSIVTNPGALGYHATNQSRYTLHETQIRGANVRQYAGLDGKVFAVSWNGKTHPDLASTLGIHYAQFQALVAKAKSARKGRHPIVVEDGTMHVELKGHFGAVSGSAWLLDQVPSGVDTHEIH